MCKTYSKEWIFLKEKKKLNIKGTVLDRYQLEQYLEKIASDHILTEKSAKDTYPIPRLKENFFVIKEIYKLLNEQIKQGIPIHPAGEWILDNLYVIEEIVKNISKELTLKKYTDFLGLANGRFKGFARVYVLATEMVAYTDGKINSENLEYMLQALSEHLPLTLINNKEMLVVLTATLALLIFTDTKIRLKDLFMLAGLTLLMFMTRRQESMLVLLGSAVLATLITQLFTKYDEKGLKEFEDIAVSSLGTIAVVLLIVLLSVIEIKPKLDDKFVNPSTYPVDAAKYIKENLDVNSIKLFNEYNYGSYLLFEGIPVFIDSRADLYAPEFNGVKGKDGKYEGQDIFSDYINTSNISKYYENTFNTYGITHVILYKNSKMNIFLSRSNKYKELYSDKKFVIYERD